MHPIRRLRALATDLEGKIEVEQSIKFSAKTPELRFLLKVFPTQRNCQRFFAFLERSGFTSHGWLNNVNTLDAIGVAASETGSLRFYSQNSRAGVSMPYYEGYKFFPDAPFRKDEYFLSSLAYCQKYSKPLEAPLQALLEQYWKVLNKEEQQQLIVLKINNDKRQSWFIQNEPYHTQYYSFVNELAAKFLTDAHQQTWRYQPQFGPLNHMAFGGDNLHKSFVTFYMQSSLDELQQTAANF